MLQQTYQQSVRHWGGKQIVLAQAEAERPPRRFRTAQPEETIIEPWLTPWAALPVLWPRERIADTSLTREIEDRFKSLQQQGVRINRIEEIREYLLRFPDMMEATEEIVGEAFTYLPEAQFVLEVYRDPEIEDEHLVLYVRFKDYPEDVMERIRSVRERCRSYLIGKKGWLHVTTDFYPAE